MPRSISGPAFETGPDPSLPEKPGAAPGEDVDQRLEVMRRHLIAAKPTSGNEALRLLRAAFPLVPLAERVRAAGGIDRYRF